MEEKSYHIYLHSDKSSSMADEVAPKEESMGGAFTPTKDDSEIEDLQSLGVAVLGKVAPALAVAVAAYKIADKVITTGFQHLEEYTGNYHYSMDLNNVKSVVGAVLNPLGTIKNMAHTIAQIDKANKINNETRQLLGITKIGS